MLSSTRRGTSRGHWPRWRGPSSASAELKAAQIQSILRRTTAATAARARTIEVTNQKPLRLAPVERLTRLAHPEDPGDRADPGQDHRHAGQPLHDHRQVVVDLGQVDIERRRRQLAVVVELVGQADHVVVDVAEVDDLVWVDQRLVAVRQLVEDLAHRADRAADLDQLALQLEQLLDGVRGRLADDLVLDVVDGVADPVREREVAVDQVVGDRPQQVVGPVLEDRLPCRRPGGAPPAGPSRRCGRSAGNPCRARCRARTRRPRRRS